MSEATEQGIQSGAAAPVEALPLPEQITPEDFSEIVQQNQIERGEVTPEAAQSPTPPVEGDPSTSAFQEEGQGTQGANNDQKLAQLEGAIRGLAQMFVQQRQAEGQNPQEADQSSMEESLTAMAPNGPQGAKQLTEIFRGEITKVLEERLNPLQEQFGQVRGAVVQSTNEKIREQYNGHLDNILNHMNVGDHWDREALKAQVTTEGTQKFGQDFNLQHAGQLLREKNNQRLRSRHAEGQAEVAAATQDAHNTPPVQTPQSGATVNNVASQVRSAVRDPGNKSMDFRGNDFQKMVKQYMDQAGDVLTGA